MNERQETPLAAFAARQAEAHERTCEALLEEYGPDRWERGAVLLFRPHPEEPDQETRAAVKIGDDMWTLTARGGFRPWIDTLIKAGSGHVLCAISREAPVGPVVSYRAEPRSLPQGGG